MWGLLLRKAHGQFCRGRLRGSPFGNGEEGAVVTQDGGKRQGQDGGQGRARTLATAEVRDQGKRSRNGVDATVMRCYSG